MSAKTSKTSFEKSLTKLDSLISTLEENTGMTRELLKAQGVSAPATVQTNIQAPTEQKPVEEKKVEEKKTSEKKSDKKSEAKEQKEQKTEKKEKKPVKAAEKSADEISAEDFARLDIRVGKIIECWKVQVGFL